MSDVPGKPESSRYQFESRIATGGMGEVWRATDQVLGREVAVKVLKPEYSDDPTFRSRFETEARNAAALHHPNVASVFDFGELAADEGSGGGRPRPYLVMELVRGEPLSALLRNGEPMPADVAADLAAQAADGLAAAHELGIVHRDVKPANLLVTADRTVKITDFGIARAADAVALTTTGQVIGTPQYLSPEQAEGRTATGASDIYSLGVVLYECLAGRRPFDADSPIATALAHIREEPPPLPDDVPEGLRRTVATALAKDPADRFASVAEFAAALRGGPVPDATTTPALAAVEEDDGTRVLAPTPTERAVPPQERQRRGVPPWLLWLAAAVAVLLIVLLLMRLSAANHNDANTAGPSSTPSASAKTSKAAPTRTTAPSKTASAPETVTVNKDDYVGRQANDAKKDLQALGLKVAQQKVDNPGDKQQGTVADVNPTGQVQKGSSVTLSVYGKPKPVDTPTASPSPGDGSSSGSGGSGGKGGGNGGGGGSGGGGSGGGGDGGGPGLGTGGTGGTGNGGGGQ